MCKCVECNKDIKENEIYGNWDDWCRECWYEVGRDKEHSEDDPAGNENFNDED